MRWGAIIKVVFVELTLGAKPGGIEWSIKDLARESCFYAFSELIGPGWATCSRFYEEARVRKRSSRRSTKCEKVACGEADSYLHECQPCDEFLTREASL